MKPFAFSAIAAGAFLAAHSAAAATIELTNPLAGKGIDSPMDLINKLINVLLILGAPILTAVVIFVGYKFVLHGDNPKEIDNAKLWLRNAIIGYAILLCAKGVESIIRSALK